MILTCYKKRSRENGQRHYWMKRSEEDTIQKDAIPKDVEW
jgi:hypothetical protein